MRRASVAFVWALLVLLAGHVHAQDAPPDPAPPSPKPAPVPTRIQQPPLPAPAPPRALELHDEAKRLYAKGKYEEAIEHLEEAVTLDPNGKVLFYNLGLIHEKRGDLDEALANYKRCLELEKDPNERVNLASIIKRLEGARRYEVLDRAAGPRPVGKTQVFEVRRGVSGWVWVTGGVALASFAGAVILAAQASAIDPGDEALTGGDVTLETLQEDADSAHALAIGSDVLVAVGALASVATLTIAIVSAETNVQTALELELGPAHGGITWRF